MERDCVDGNWERAQQDGQRPGFRREAKSRENSQVTERTEVHQDLSVVLCVATISPVLLSYHRCSQSPLRPLTAAIHAGSVLRKWREMGHHPCQHGCWKEKSKKPGNVDIDPSQSGKRNKGAHPGKRDIVCGKEFEVFVHTSHTGQVKYQMNTICELCLDSDLKTICKKYELSCRNKLPTWPCLSKDPCLIITLKNRGGNTRIAGSEPQTLLHGLKMPRCCRMARAGDQAQMGVVCVGYCRRQGKAAWRMLLWMEAVLNAPGWRGNHPTKHVLDNTKRTKLRQRNFNMNWILGISINNYVYAIMAL